MQVKTGGSRFNLKTTPNQACTVTSSNPGNAILKRWSPEPTPPIPGVVSGSDANNMTLTFGLRDSYNLPIPNTAVAPNYNGNVAGIQTPNTAGYQVSYADAWIVAPAGITSISFNYRGFGNTSGGIYIGKSPRYATLVMWNNVVTVPGGTVDMAKFFELCGQKIAFVRFMQVNGYFNGGGFLTWNVGAGFVDVPLANTHGAQPYVRKYP